ncbi:WPP domain-interacting protein 2-like [Carya illinoinensis]|uniref:WPP domain-interacting protein 2-like n=2 Tax=Carya illinoinensis TaxID=32201 RepID=A0A8T1NRQ6_CARIL|nr:WPP domain-interacting protein 2-like [Carya illinoinensis]XP_042951535.1 WPP domain-interacting protein 2-like [Carya illinoinensis]KAG6634816.1 hypothetical protein CIPAW_12G142900 [Carya illinoinensis]
MDLSHLTRECSVLESGEESEVAQHRNPHDDGREIRNNGTYPDDIGKLVSTENSGANTSTGENTKEEDVESAEGGTSPPPNATSPGGSSPGGRKRYGLKKWRRIKRESVSYAGEDKDLSLDDLAENLSWQVKEEKSENRQPSTYRDPLVDSFFSLQSVQEALEKEVHKLKDIGKEPTSQHDSSTTGRCMPADFTTTDSETYMPSSPDRLGSVKIRQTALTSLESQVLSLMKDLRFLESKLEETGAMLEAKDLRIVELEATISRSKSPKEESSTSIGIQDEKCRETEIGLDSVFKQKIEAEVEHLAIIRTVQKMKVAAAEQFSKEQSFVAGKQAQVQNKLGEAQSKAMMLEKQAEVETYCGDRVGAKEVLKLQRACKLTSCFLIQLIFLVIVFWYFVLQSSPPPGGVVVVVPT